ncbi:MAG: LysM peptidoglycan-binding domain-containing protein [Planctomycetia bacterium]
MAKVEKFVVLTVLFVIAVVLVVSLSGDNPLDKDNAAKLGEKPQAKPAESTGTQGGSPLLSVNVQPEAPAATPAQSPAQAAAQPAPAPAAPAATLPSVTLPSVTLPQGALLKTTEGLSPSFDDKRLFYRWQQGDGWVKLAERLYGNGAKFSLLKNANEGRDDIQPGEQILVPIFDVESMAAAPANAAPAEPAASKPATAGDKKSSKKAALVSTGGKVHEVKKGESLWKIAKSELGDGNRWKEIYEINKDQMKSPEAVRVGMKLKLP